VIDRLTSVRAPVPGGGSARGRRFYRLVTSRLRNDAVGLRDLRAFALSLTGGVQRLHRAEILHCDIRPQHVLWDAAARTAHLVGFGRAQREAGARAYAVTFGYTAPEVLWNDEPHSRRSDAYSVGLTLLEAAPRRGWPFSAARAVQDVARMLSCDDPRARIDLWSARSLVAGTRA
jgi:serine/threonine protein kinase